MILQIDTNTYSDVFVCGDIHGEFRTVVYQLKHKQITDAVIIVAGDCGVGFYKPNYYSQLYEMKLEPALSEMNCMLLLVRGNHDDPECFEKELIAFPRMKTIPDYSVIQFGEHNILCVGGATSIDRPQRLEAMAKGEPKCYWEDESVRYDAETLNYLKAKGIAIDTVVTHTAPSFCFPYNKIGISCCLERDDKLSADLDKEREDMDKIFNHLQSDNHPITHWFYAHFHTSHTDYINNIKFQLLDVMGINHIAATYYI